MVTASAYREAIQNPQLNLGDAELKTGDPLRDALGLPRAVSGNFASVFTLACGARRYAVKCFFNEFTDQLHRYRAIHECLHSFVRPWEVEFEFQPQGIRVGRDWHPIVKMEWIDAVRLDKYVADHLHDRVEILDLASRFAELVTDLRSCGIAHGDLQHGNVLVTKSGQLRLVDYDGMYVPALAGIGSHELGHPNYQHPARSHDDFYPELDNFSAWVIYVSLIALAVDPSIWARVDGGEEQLVFKRQDFEATIYSPGFGALQMTGDPQLADLAAEMKDMIARGPGAAPELVPIEVELVDGATTFAPSAPSSSSAGANRPSGLPVWMANEASVTGPAQGTSSPGLQWMIGQLPSSAKVEFSGVGSVPKRLLQAVGLTLLLLSALGVTGVLAVRVDVALGALTLLVAAGAEAVLYRRSPECRQRRQSAQVLAEQRRAVRAAEEQFKALERDHSKIEAQQKKDLAKLDAEVARVRKDELEKLQSAQKRLQSKVDDIARRRIEIQQEEQQARATALKKLQDSVYLAELVRHSVNELQLSYAIKAGLRSGGMESAADIRGTQGEYVVRTDGTAFKIHGVGPVKARTINAWVVAAQSHAQALMPHSLSASADGTIRNKYAAKMQPLSVEEQQARLEGEQAANAVRASSQQQQVQLVEQTNAVRLSYGQQAAQTRSEIGAAGQDLTAEQWKEAQVTRDSEAFAGITFSRFLAAAIRSR